MENKDFKKIFTRQQKYLRGDHEVDSVLATLNTNLEIVEGGLGSDAIDQDEALTILHVQISHGCELFLEQNILNSCLKQFQNSRPCIYSFITFQKDISVRQSDQELISKIE